jgi:hypothetical protein
MNRQTSQPINADNWEDAFNYVRDVITSAPEHMRSELMERYAVELVSRARREINVDCERCVGRGIRSYGSTSTWAGGIGGCEITTDVCDSCWGTGRNDRTGTDLRKLMNECRQSERKSSTRWFARQIGAGLSTVKPRLLEVAARLKIKRSDDMWQQMAIKSVQRAIRELCDEPNQTK